jgi:DNA-binding response OmpR family regulator
MATEIILLVDDAEQPRGAVAESLARAGSYVEAVPDCAAAIEFMVVFRPDWVLVTDRQAPDLLAWIGRQERLRGVPVVICPDLHLGVRQDEDREPATNAA